MAKTAPEALITALDIGSAKVSAMIAKRGDGGELIVLGTGQRESKGVKRGYISDIRATEAAVREAVEQAERIAGTNIEDVWVSFSAGGLVSDVVAVEVELGGHKVEQRDIDDLLQAGREAIDPGGRMVLHAQPTLYTLDRQTGAKQPLGLHADRLGVHIHVVATDGSPVRSRRSPVRSCGSPARTSGPPAARSITSMPGTRSMARRNRPTSRSSRATRSALRRGTPAQPRTRRGLGVHPFTEGDEATRRTMTRSVAVLARLGDRLGLDDRDGGRDDLQSAQPGGREETRDLLAAHQLRAGRLGVEPRVRGVDGVLDQADLPFEVGIDDRALDQYSLAV